jgi:hypothetical protein
MTLGKNTPKGATKAGMPSGPFDQWYLKITFGKIHYRELTFSTTASMLGRERTLPEF